MIIISNVKDAKDYPADEYWIITRYLLYPTDNFKHVKELSPSTTLLQEYTKIKQSGNEGIILDFFDSIVVPTYLEEIKYDRNKKDILNELIKKDREGKVIVLSCFCEREDLCHRSIIAGLLQGYNANVETETNLDYSKYKELYLNTK